MGHSRRCTKCGETKDIHEFYVKKSGPPEERLHRCKDCVRSYQREYSSTPSGRASKARHGKKAWERGKRIKAALQDIAALSTCAHLEDAKNIARKALEGDDADES
jgi:recombinational DNA repair protein (RecF pathway)